MKCNRCTAENDDTALYCKHCGAQLQPGEQVSVPVGQNGTVVTGTFTANGPTLSVNNPTKNSKVGVIIASIIAAIMVIGAIVLVVLKFTGSEQVVRCTKETEYISQSIAGTFNGKSLSKLEYAFIVEADAIPEDEDDDEWYYDEDGYGYGSSEYGDYEYSYTEDEDGTIHFSYSGAPSSIEITDPGDDDTDITIYSNGSSSSSSSHSSSQLHTMSDSELQDLMAIAFMMMSFEQYAGQPGVEFTNNETSTLQTVSFSVDFTKADRKIQRELFDDEELSAESFQAGFKDLGYVCEIRK